VAGKAAEWAAARITGEELDHIRALADSVTDASGPSAPRPDELVAANWRFHRAVHLASGSPRIVTLIRQTVGVVPTNFFDVFPDQGQHSAADHDELVGALTRHDGPGARRVAERHVTDAGEPWPVSWRRVEETPLVVTVVGVTPRSRSRYFSTLPVAVRGNSPAVST